MEHAVADLDRGVYPPYLGADSMGAIALTAKMLRASPQVPHWKFMPFLKP